MNMPFELGIDYGSRQHGPEFMRGKKCLILEKEAYDFKAALSDMSGVDIKSHRNKPEEVVRAVRDWFYETVGLVQRLHDQSLRGETRGRHSRERRQGGHRQDADTGILELCSGLGSQARLSRAGSWN